MLGVDPATVARRWQRLEAEGLAWVHAAVNTDVDQDLVRAWVEVRVAGVQVDKVAGQLAAEPNVLSLRLTAGERELLALLANVDLDEMAQFVGTHIAAIDGVRSTRTHLITEAPITGADWRLNVLKPDERAAMEAGSTPVLGRRARLDAADAAIATELERDGRAGVTEIAERAGLGISTVRRRLPGLLSSGTLMVHCDVSRQVSGYPVSAVYFASVPAVHLEKVTSSLRTLPGLRLCSIVAGPDNLVLDVWLESLRDVHQLENFVSKRLKSLDVRIADRAVTLRTYKHHGRVLDVEGRAVIQ